MCVILVSCLRLQHELYAGTICSAGHYCTGGSSAMITCPIGTYASSMGSTSPACGGLCAVGHFGNTTGQSSSTCSGPCTAAQGSYCPAGSNSTSGVLCPPGSFCVGGAADRAFCPEGTFGATAGLATASCSGACDEGYFGGFVGLTTSACTAPCTAEAGYHCAEGSNSTNGERGC